MYNRRLLNIMNAEKIGMHHEAGMHLSETMKRWERHANSVFQCFSAQFVRWDAYNGLPAEHLLENLLRLLGIYTAGSDVREGNPFAAFSKTGKISGRSAWDAGQRGEIIRSFIAPNRKAAEFVKEGKPAIPVINPIHPAAAFFPNTKDAGFQNPSADIPSGKTEKKMPPLRPHASLTHAMQVWKSGVKPAHSINGDLKQFMDDPLPTVLNCDVDDFRDDHNELGIWAKINYQKPLVPTLRSGNADVDAPASRNKKRIRSYGTGRRSVPGCVPTPERGNEKSSENRNKLTEKIIEIQKKKQQQGLEYHSARNHPAAPFRGLRQISRGIYPPVTGPQDECKQQPEKGGPQNGSPILKDKRPLPPFPNENHLEFLIKPLFSQNQPEQNREPTLSLFLREWESERLGNKHSSYSHPDTFSQEDTIFPPSSEGKGTDLRDNNAYRKPPGSRFLRNDADKMTASGLNPHWERSEPVRSSRDSVMKKGKSPPGKRLLEDLVNGYWEEPEAQTNRDGKLSSLETKGHSAISELSGRKSAEHLIFERNTGYEPVTPARKRAGEGESPDALSRKIEEALKEQARRYGIDL